MGRISIFLSVLMFGYSAHCQDAEAKRGDGKQSVFFGGNPQFISINVDHILHDLESGRQFALRTGFMTSFELWMGIPLEFNLLVPVGNDVNHLEVGLIGAYTWNSLAHPYRYYGGPRLGFRRQKDDYGVFYRFGIAYTIQKYVTREESENQIAFKPHIGIGYSF